MKQVHAVTQVAHCACKQREKCIRLCIAGERDACNDNPLIAERAKQVEQAESQTDYLVAVYDNPYASVPIRIKPAAPYNTPAGLLQFLQIW